MFDVTLSVAAAAVGVAAVARPVAEALNQLVVLQQLEVTVIYHAPQAANLALQTEPLVGEFRQTVVLAPDGVAEHAAKQDQHGHRRSEHDGNDIRHCVSD